mgnify:CR=1 FL=1
MLGVQMNKKNIRVRKGQAPGKLSRDDFRARFFGKFTDPAFGAEGSALKRIEIIAWNGYTRHRKTPRTHPAGRGYADPSYDLSDEWRATSFSTRPNCLAVSRRCTGSTIFVITKYFTAWHR